jgi:hypothetical protein
MIMKATNEQQQIDQALKATLQTFVTSLIFLCLFALLLVRGVLSLCMCILSICNYSAQWVISRLVDRPEVRTFALFILKDQSHA